MVPTYFWRFGLIGPAMEGAGHFDELNSTVMILLLISYLGMAYVSYLRGKESGKGYIFAFPIVGGVFDLILVFVPFVPTVMNIITIVLGMSSPKGSLNYVDSRNDREEIECPSCAESILKKARRCRYCGHEMHD